jgi:WD40 repeat protein
MNWRSRIGFLVGLAVLLGLSEGTVAAQDMAGSNPNVPAPASIPRIIVQLDHASPVDAAAWFPDNPGRPPHSRLLTADAADNSVIIWDTLTRKIIDKLSIPQLDPDGLFEAQSIRSLRFDSEGRIVRIVIDGLSRNSDDSDAVALFSFDFDTITRRFQRAGPPQPRASINDITLISQEANRSLPKSPDGQIALYRVRNGLALTSGDRSPSKGVLDGIARETVITADLSPGGDRLATLRTPTYLGSGPEVLAINTRTGQPLPLYTTPDSGNYNRLRWIGSDHYAVIDAGGGYPWTGGGSPTIIVDAASGRQIATAAARCMTTPVDSDGLLVGTGPGSCGGKVTGADGLWLFQRGDPAGKGFSTDRVWVKQDVPQLRDALITTLAVDNGNDSHGAALTIAVRRRDASGGYTARVLRIAVVSGSLGAATERGGGSVEDTGWPGHLVGYQRTAVTSDPSGPLVIAYGSQLRLKTGTAADPIQLDVRNAYPEILAVDANSVIFAARDFQYIQRFDARSGKRLAPVHVPGGVLNGGTLADLPVFWAISRDGAVRLWDSRSGDLLLTYYRFSEQDEGTRHDGFFVFRPDGRYDTNLGPETPAVRWLMPDLLWQALPPQTLMRSHYTPALFAKLLGCVSGGCGADVFPPLPDTRGFNRARPETNITSVVPGPAANEVTVNLAVTATSVISPGRDISSGIHDLRLFRDGRLVAQSPDRLLTPAIAASNDLWRRATSLPVTDVDTNPTVKPCQPRKQSADANIYVACFIVPVPSGKAPIAFTAYAFNSDRIKGDTARSVYTPAVAVPPRPRRTFVIAIGVDATDNPAWHLNYAANDAHAIIDALRAMPGRTVTSVELTSTATAQNATKAMIAAVLRHLNGFAEPADRAALVSAGIDPARLTPLTPDDSVILAFSGHGVTEDGEFYMVPSDAQRGPDGKPVLASLMSSTELTQWARNIQSGELAMIIDACHSAASVTADGFKAGPMGDPGLGQLAYDKRFRILAATQADDVALEDGELGHGLLTYALVVDGLKAAHGAPLPADLDGDGVVRLDEWLNYGVARLPVLAEAIRSGSLHLQSGPTATTARMIENFDDVPLAPGRERRVQEPALFDFTNTASPLVLRRSTAGGQQ